MDRSIEKALSARAVELGRAGEPAGLPELLDLLGKPSGEVRRLAVSAIGKLAGLVDARDAVPALHARLLDPHPQVRQYAIKTLSAYGADASSALDDLEDIAVNPIEKEYNRRDAAKAIEVIREAVRIAEEQAVHLCQRCGTQVATDEFARSQRAFQRVYCDNCFDEKFVERRNFDIKVELNKTIRAKDGTLVQSRGERRIAEWLSANGVAYRYDERFRIIDGYAIRPDFYLPEFDVYIEYWGMDTADYKIGMLKKQTLYQSTGKKLVSIFFQEFERIEEVLDRKLRTCSAWGGQVAS
ncbi:MAG TPA: hypothetical protein DCS43_15235 [Verrucomicrobia bacterium]|nr:hypothetical protein [Verrucomicrobiota bacterium]